MAGVKEQIYRGSGEVSPAAALPQSSPQAFGAGIGDAIAGAGSEVYGAAMRAQAVERDRQRESVNAQAATDVAQLSINLSRSAQAARDQAPLDGSGHVQRIEQESAAAVNDFLEKIPDAKVRQHWQARVAEVRGKLIEQEDGWARGRRLGAIKTNALEARRLRGNLLQSNPDPETFEQSLKDVDTFWNGTDGPADVKDAGRREDQADAAQNFARGMIEKDPAGAFGLLHAGGLDAWISPDDKKVLVNEAQAAVHAAELQAEKQQRQLASQAHDYLDVLSKRFADGDPTISDDELAKAQQLAGSLGDAGKAYDVAKWRTWKTVDTAYKGASSLQISQALRALDAKIRKTPEPISLPTDGLRAAGNIDVHNRPVAHNADGSISTVRTISIGTDKGEVLIPTVIDGKIIGKEAAIAHYRETGEHLGIFDNAAHATAYAKALHAQQAAEYGGAATADDVVRRDRLQTLLERRQREEHEDPLGTVDVAPLDFGNQGSIQARAAAANAARGETGRYSFFTPEELPGLREEIASGPAGKLDVINKLSAIAAVDGQAALRAAGQIDGQDRTLRHAMRVAAPVREMIVRGSVLRQTLPKSVIGPEGKGASLDTLTQDWFADNVSPALINAQPDFSDDVLETARAIYADWRRRSNAVGQEEEFNAEQFRRSVGLALGAMNGRGGVGDWQYGPKRSNGRAFPFVLPSTMTEDEAERRFGNPAIVAGAGKAPPGSVNGTPVWASGKPMSQFELTRKFVPVAIADGIYQFRSGGQVVQTAEHRPFQVDIRKLDPIHSVIAPKGSGPRLAPIAPDYSLPSHPEVRGPEYRQ